MTQTFVNYEVHWRNPEANNQWEVYQQGLSYARAVKLADTVRTVMSPRWSGVNAETRVVPMSGSNATRTVGKPTTSKRRVKVVQLPSGAATYANGDMAWASANNLARAGGHVLIELKGIILLVPERDAVVWSKNGHKVTRPSSV